jgi:hypothetical protein
VPVKVSVSAIVRHRKKLCVSPIALARRGPVGFTSFALPIRIAAPFIS